METKPFWTSKTFWVNLLAIVASVLGVFHIDVLTPEVQAQVVVVIMGVVNIVLRFMTDKGINAG